MIENIYFSCCLTTEHRKAEIMSLGMVSESGQKYYGEITTFNRKQMSVIGEKFYQGFGYCSENNYNKLTKIENLYYTVGSYLYIKQDVLHWLSQFQEVQLIGHRTLYNGAALIDLLGALDGLPEFISPYVIDIVPEISKYKGISEKEAYQFPLERFCYHNAVTTAMQIKNMYNRLWNHYIVREG